MKYQHPIDRARERYHADLTPADFDRMKYLVRVHRPEALPLGVTPDGAILVAIRYRPEGSRRRWLATVWRGGDVLTVLPPRSLTRFGRRLHARRRALRRMGLEKFGVRPAAATLPVGQSAGFKPDQAKYVATLNSVCQ